MGPRLRGDDDVVPRLRGDDGSPAPYNGAMGLYAATIFLSAFLLFLVQPIIAKQILPWFGGSAAVWTTCLVFFQSTLLAGYAYADVVARRMRADRGAMLHGLVLVAAIACLPIIPAAHWKPAGGENPAWLILGLLVVTIGPPYFALSTTSPLVQAWFARRFPGRSPYRLFALSNFASMLALVGYPFAIEPWIATRDQASWWSWGFAVFALLCSALAWRTLQSLPRDARALPLATSAPAGAAERVAPAGSLQLLWIALAAVGSVLLLAVSNHIAENVAAVPLLWIVPLTIYLATFILCFDSDRWYRRGLFHVLAALALGAMAWTLADSRVTHELALQFGVSCAGLFVACMFCHGELASTRPSPRYLTRFYLMVALGGALGAALVGIAAPMFLRAGFELGFGLVACALLLVLRSRAGGLPRGALAVVALLGTIGASAWSIRQFYDSTIFVARNFYGILRVQESGSGDSLHRSLIHGTIMHGNQYLSPDRVREPSTYYTATSGLGVLLETLNPRLEPLRLGMIGLGTGTVAAWGAKGDVFRIYDINPAVIGIAKEYFSYLRDSDATIETVLGDARLSLEREPPQQFDVLAIDAFSSDAIPVHLITDEAMGVYLRHMKPDGVIAFHVTNRFLALAPVVDAIARAHGLVAVHVDDSGAGELASVSDWVLVARNDSVLGRDSIKDVASAIEPRPGWRLWTDDFNNIVQVLKR